jgi:LPXTG-motif cell wall-anchored protein
MAAGLVLFAASPASAAGPAQVGLGTADSFAVLGGQAVTNTGPSVINGDLGVSPGNSITGFPPGIINGGLHFTDGVAAGAQADLVTAYDSVGPLAPTETGLTALDGRTLIGGVYDGGALGLGVGGTVTLDAQGETDSVWVFRASSTLIMNSGSTVALINGANACNVFWRVESSATIGTGSDFTGTVMALTSIAAQTGATIDGRLLARNGSVTLDNNVITSSDCAATTETGDLPEDVTITEEAGSITGIFGPGAEPVVTIPAVAPDVPTLAETGPETDAAIITSGALLVAGTALLLTSRRRRRHV